MRKNIFTLLLCLIACGFACAQDNVITQELQEILNQKNDDYVDVNIVFKQQTSADELTSLSCKSDSKDIRREVMINHLKKTSKQAQESSRKLMSVINAEERSSSVIDIKSHWLTNSINCKAKRDVIYQLASHPDIAFIDYNSELELIYDVEENVSTASMTRGSGNVTANLTHIQADKVWDLGYTGKGILVAILDSGVNYDHIDLKDHLWNGNQYHGYNAINPGTAPLDQKGHGTHVAGTICGDGTSGTTTGVAPDATLMCINVSSGGTSTKEVLVDAIEFAAENGADVINMSMGWFASDEFNIMLRQAFANTLQLGMVASVAAGNYGNDQGTHPIPDNITCPANCPPPYLHDDQVIKGGLTSVISVGAVDENNAIAGLSSRGPAYWEISTNNYNDYPYNGTSQLGLIRPDICAVGTSVKSLDYENLTATGSNPYPIKAGTSQAAPAVAGVIALMLEKNPDLTPAEICRIIEETATPLGGNTKNNTYGSGCINALAAVQEVTFNVQGAYLNKYNYTKTFNATGTNQNLELTLINNGTSATSSATTVTLTSNDSNVIVANGTATINNTIAVNATATCNFSINVSTSAPDNHVAKFTVTTIGSSSRTFDIEIEISNELVAPAVTTSVNGKDITLSWSATNNATGYNIYRDGAYLANTSSTSYTDAGLEYGTLYSYTVTSLRGSLESEHSMIARVQTEDNPDVPSPTNVRVNGNVISWNNSTGSLSSNVYRKEALSDAVTLASKISGTSYTDSESLGNGIYQYGVSNNHTSAENLYKEGFDDVIVTNTASTYEAMNMYWYYYNEGGGTYKWETKSSHTQTGNTYTPYMGTNAVFIQSLLNNSSRLTYLVSRQMDYTQYNGSDAKLSFYYITPAWGSDINTLKVMVSTSSYTGSWTELWSSNKTDVSTWTKAEVDLNAYLGQTFYIAFVNVAGYGYCTGLDEVSVDVEGSKESRIEWSESIYNGVNVFAQDGVWNDADNWGTNTLPGENDHVIIDANVTLNGEVTVKSLSINNGTLTLNEGAKLTVTGELVNTNTEAFIINDGAQVIQGNENVAATFNMNIVNPEEWSKDNKTGWQFITSPVKDASISTFVPSTGDYDLFRYDGSKDLEWIKHKDQNEYPEEPTITIDTITFDEGTTAIVEAPSWNLYENSYTQTIYTNDDLGGNTGTIKGIAYHQYTDHGSATDRTIDVYIANTNKGSFSSKSDYVSMSDEYLVYSGKLEYQGAGEWIYITLDKGFEYTGGNIIISVNDKTGGWMNPATQYLATSVTSARTLCYYRDGSQYAPSSPGTGGKTMSTVNNMKFVIESGSGGGNGQDPETPEGPTVPSAPVVTATATGSSTILLQWETVDGATSYKVYSGDYELTTTSATSYTVSYLQSATESCFSVSAVNEVGESEATEACATTKLATPQNLAAEVTGASSIDLRWDAVNKATSYNVYQGSSQIATNITETTFTVEGLEEGVQYCFTVTAYSQDAGESVASAEVCAIPATDSRCVVDFILKDSYSDTWSGNYLLVSYGGQSIQLTLDENGVAEKTYTLKIPTGTHVSMAFYKVSGWTYPTENSWTIQYEDGTVIHTGIGVGSGQGTTNSETYEFDINCGTGGGEDPGTGTEPEPEDITVEIGSNATGYSYWVPFCDYYGNFISQQIYTKDEIGYDAGTINGLSFKVYSGSQVTRTLEVYLKNIDQESFSGYSFISLSSSDKVFDGSVTVGAAGTWCTIPFTTSFDYTGKNIVVCVYDKTGTGLSSYHYFYSTAVSGKTLYTSNSSVTPTTLANGSVTTYRNQIKFDMAIIPSAPQAPVVTVNSASTSVTLSWNSVSGADSYNVYQDGTSIATGLTETTFTVEGLSEATEYCFTVSAVNELGETASAEVCATTKSAPTGPFTVEIGADQNPDYSGNFYLPVYDYSAYAISQQIYLKDEIGADECMINSVSFKIGSGSQATRQYEVYMKNTDQSTFSGSSYIAMTASDKVFDGSVEVGATGTWCTINFTTPFEYAGNNIVLCVYDKTGSGLTSGYHQFYKFNATGRSLYSNGYNAYNVTSLTTGSTRTYVSQVKFDMAPKQVVSTVTVEIGADQNPNYSGNYYYPSYDYAKYSISQQIYTKDEIGYSGGSISSLSFKIGSGSTATRQYEVYMKNTDQSTFSGGSYIAMTASDKVFDGSVSVGTAGAWCTINLTTPFNYTGNNIVVCVYDKTGSGLTSGYHTYYKFSATGRDLYSQGGNSYNPASLTTGSSRSYVMQVQFEMAVSEAKSAYNNSIVKSESISQQTTDNGQQSRGTAAFESTFQQGVGYMASYENATAATFKGNLNHEKSFSFKVAYNADKNSANFHLLGNPFTFNMNWNNIVAEGLAAGYATVTYEGGYEYHADGEIKVGDGFFVKAIAENPSLSYKVQRSNDEKGQSLNVIASGSAGSDNVVINLAGEQDGFPKLKNFNDNIANLFVSENDQRYGIYNCKADAQQVEIAFEAKQMGNYSIIIEPNGKFSEIVLIDRLENIEHNMLLNNEYKFFSTNGINNRFLVKFSLNDGDQDENFVYQSGDELIINAEGDVQIFDVMGRMVYSNDVESDRRINISNFKKAAYIVRCISDSNVKTQKIVVL